MQRTISDRIKLNNGTEIPYFGFGTYQIKGTAAKESVLTALEAGYRYIDTAAAYGNEKEVGEAVRESRLPRNEIFISTKLWNEDQGYDTAFEAFERSLDELGLKYIDLYLLHWPVTGMRLESWRALENIVKTDRCNAIGVCNFTIEHLGELLESVNIVPAVNQVEFNPFLFQKELLDYCKSKDIRLSAYTPLSRGRKLDHPILRDLSGKYRKTPAQILIRWAIEHELIVIPKSENKKRIFENADIFDFTITQIDMKKLDALNEGFRVAWDPSTIK
jgi:diketogulonate reductase-like aldo/keto reductase